MKKISKILALILVGVMLLTMLAACGNDPSTQSSDPGTQSSEPGNQPSDPGTAAYEFEKMTIGLFGLNWTSSPYSEWKAYLGEYIGPRYNVKFEFNTETNDAEGEKAFLEKMGAVGAKGVIGITTGNLDNCLDICSQFGMMYVGNVPMDYDLSAMSAEMKNAFAGIVGQSQEFRVAAGYDMAMAVLSKLDQSKPMVVKALGLNPAAGLPPTAGPLLQMKGIQQAIEELRGKGAQIDFEEVYPSGFSPADWAAAADNALAGIGGAANSALLTASTIDNTMQAVVNSGNGIPYGGFSGVTTGNEQYFADGLITASGETGLPCNVPAVCFVMLYNAITGHKLTDAAGDPTTVNQVDPITVSSYEDYQEILAHVYTNEGGTYYTTELLDQYLYVLNPEVTLDSFTAFANSDLRGK